jgi:hypothetical protein
MRPGPAGVRADSPGRPGLTLTGARRVREGWAEHSAPRHPFPPHPTPCAAMMRSNATSERFAQAFPFVGARPVLLGDDLLYLIIERVDLGLHVAAGVDDGLHGRRGALPDGSSPRGRRSCPARSVVGRRGNRRRRRHRQPRTTSSTYPRSSIAARDSRERPSETRRVSVCVHRETATDAPRSASAPPP